MLIFLRLELEVELSSVTFFVGCRALFMCIVSGALAGVP